MQSTTLKLALRSALAISALTASLPAQAADPLTGTWKLDVAKSTYNPGRPPKEVTLTVEAAGQGVKVVAKGVDADGSPTQVEYTANYDRKDYPVSESPDYDTVSLRRINARTTVTTRKQGGKVVQTMRREFSRDGKRMTGPTTGTNAKGQKIQNVAVFEPQ
jgi:hypothetical protein